MDRLTYFDNGHYRLMVCGVEYADFPFVEKLAAYENSELEPDEVKALVNEQKNEPLTLEELKGMDGEPVWIDSKYLGGWHILDYFGREVVYMIGDDEYVIDSYGKTWLAYRHKKED